MRHIYRDNNKIWHVTRLFKLVEDLEPFEIPIKHLNVYGLYPHATSTKDFVDHVDRILKADLTTPIILDDEGYVMDGRHRIIKALLEKKEHVKAVRFDETPEPCYIEPENNNN